MAYIPVFGILSITFFVIRKIYNASNGGGNTPKQYFIKADLQTGVPLIKKLALSPGEPVSLVNGSEGFEVHVEARGTGSYYELIGKVDDRELYARVRKNSVRGKIFNIDGDLVTIEFTY